MSARARLAEVDEEEGPDEEYEEYEEGARGEEGVEQASARAPVAGDADQRSLALGFLAMAPMFLAY